MNKIFFSLWSNLSPVQRCFPELFQVPLCLFFYYYILLMSDVVSLELKDFKKIARHESLISLFKQYDGDQQYSSQLWAVLNKSCDLVHNAD